MPLAKRFSFCRSRRRSAARQCAPCVLALTLHATFRRECIVQAKEIAFCVMTAHKGCCLLRVCFCFGVCLFVRACTNRALFYDRRFYTHLF